MTATDAGDDAYWQQNFASRPYAEPGMEFEGDYLPAYRYGVAVSDRYEDQPFDAVAAQVKTGWDESRGASRLDWDKALPAVKDAFDRVIRLREERLTVDKQQVQAGEARLSKRVVTRHEEVTVPVQHEELVVERRAVNRVVSGAEIGRGTDDVRVPLERETATAGKETVLTEEVSVGTRAVTGQETVGADLKREELVVEEEGAVKRAAGTSV